MSAEKASGAQTLLLECRGSHEFTILGELDRQLE